MLKVDWDDLTTGTKGDWYFHRNDTYITLRWGDDVLEVVSLPIVIGGSTGPAWGWNGNKDKPTLTPSILIRGNHGAPDQWHGFLRDGLLIDA